MPNPFATSVAQADAPSDVSPNTARIMVAVAAALLLPIIGLAVSLEGRPAWWRPFPLAVVFAVVMLRSKLVGFALVTVLGVGGFLLFCQPLLRGRTEIPFRSMVFVPLHLLNGLYLLASYHSGLRHMGKQHTLTICAITLALVAVMMTLSIVSARRPHFGVALVFQWLAWGGSILYLFPMLTPLFTLV